VTLGAADERAHRPDGDGWWEAWQLDVASDDGVGVAVLLACAPALGWAWWWTHVILPDRPGPIVVRDHEVPLPRVGLEVRADGLWGELVCETPFEHWTYGLEAFGVALDDPGDSLEGEIGERMPVGCDLEWEVDPENASPRERAGATLRGYEQFGVVHGEVLLGRSRVAIDAIGRRVHAWGVPQWDQRVAEYWAARRGAGATSAVVDALPAAVPLGAFVVPLDGPGGERDVLRRALCRYRPSGEIAPSAAIGWSTVFEPE
jgi:hypothetical protein